MKRHGKIWHHLFIIPAVAVFIGAFGCAVMLLWNALLPRIAGLPLIGFWEAAGLLVLARILFGGPGWMGGHHHGSKNMFRDKWLNMSGEERKEFVAKFQGLHHSHCGFRGEGGDSPGSDSGGPEKA